jgi:transcriptional regulator with XRE-family HTH domain
MQEKNDTNVSIGLAASLSVAIHNSGLSKRAFAERCGLTHGAINNYLTGRMPKLDEAMRIARFLGLTVDELVNGEQAQPRAGAAVWRERAIAAEQRLAAVKDGMTALLKKI